MKSLKPSKKWILSVIGILLVLFILKLVLLLTAKPKITADYIAEYNRITRPVNYDPNDNAALYYQKAFDAFVEMPIELRLQYINWPTDFNDTEQALLENWLASNSQAFEFFQIAADKPYYWMERHLGEDDYILNMLFTEIVPLKHLSEALLWNAKLTASKGRSKTAFENIINCYRAGRQKCRTPSFLTEQSVGMSFKLAAIKSALLILDKTPLDNSALKSFQAVLQAEFDRDTYVPDFTADKLTLYDALQRTFIDNGRGTGRLAWSTTEGFAIILYGWSNIKMQLNCFFGPTRNQTAAQAEKEYAIYNQIAAKTPWQIKNEGRDYFEEIEKINNSNFLLQILSISPESIPKFLSYHQSKSHAQALLAVLAILRYKADNYQFPASLDELVAAGYLKAVPIDPYSDGSMVYKPSGDDFKLYSVGEDFVDDGGLAVFTSSHPSGLRGDIIFWPVRQFEHHRKEFENRKIEKEAESQEKIEEAK